MYLLDICLILYFFWFIIATFSIYYFYINSPFWIALPNLFSELPFSLNCMNIALTLQYARKTGTLYCLNQSVVNISKHVMWSICNPQSTQQPIPFKSFYLFDMFLYKDRGRCSLLLLIANWLSAFLRYRTMGICNILFVMKCCNTSNTFFRLSNVSTIALDFRMQQPTQSYACAYHSIWWHAIILYVHAYS